MKLGPIDIKNPVLIASGCAGFGKELYEIGVAQKVGAVILKTITFNPREGNEPPRLLETEFGLLNRVGLENPGLEGFLKREIPAIKNMKNATFLVSVAPFSEKEASVMAKEVSLILGDNILGVEINLSCPNVENTGIICENAELSIKIVSEFLKWIDTDRFLLTVKISPFCCPNLLAKNLLNIGVPAISVFNTLPAAYPLENNQFFLGGLSGPCLFPVTLRAVFVLKSLFKIVIAGGGVFEKWQFDTLLKAGANAVAIGSIVLKDPFSPLEFVEP